MTPLNAPRAAITKSIPIHAAPGKLIRERVPVSRALAKRAESFRASTSEFNRETKDSSRRLGTCINLAAMFAETLNPKANPEGRGMEPEALPPNAEDTINPRVTISDSEAMRRTCSILLSREDCTYGLAQWSYLEAVELAGKAPEIPMRPKGRLAKAAAFAAGAAASAALLFASFSGAAESAVAAGLVFVGAAIPFAAAEVSARRKVREAHKKFDELESGLREVQQRAQSALVKYSEGVFELFAHLYSFAPDVLRRDASKAFAFTEGLSTRKYSP
jgi:hypothetical protein